MATLIEGTRIYVPVFKVKLNKNFLPRESITGIEIEEDLEKPTLFRISLNEEINMDTQQFNWLDNDLIKPGTEAIISFGYAMSEKQGLIRGRIKALSPGFLSSGIPTLSIEGYDLSHDLQNSYKGFEGEDLTYSMVAQKIADNNKLKPDGVESADLTHPKVERRTNENDYATLRRLSSEIGFEFFVRDDILYFRQPRDNTSEEFTFEFRKNFISFNPRMTTASLANEVSVSSWYGKDKEDILETASISDIKNSMKIQDFDSIIEQSQGKKISVKMEGRVVRSKKEAKDLAITELKKRNKRFIEGSLECIGDPKLRPGITVKIEKVGKKFSGIYYVTRAKHSIGDGGYKTTLDVSIRRRIP
ncbi:MAG: hypothetical protein WA130_10055 [Candidatus Methanoperedens sp.]